MAAKNQLRTTRKMVIKNVESDKNIVKLSQIFGKMSNVMSMILDSVKCYKILANFTLKVNISDSKNLDVFT